MVIKELLKYPVVFILKRLDLYSLYSLKKIGPLKEDGWFRSVKENRCVDLSGNSLPWLTYPAIEFLKKRVRKNMSVFEYGCGESTYWWAGMVNEVISVEHDREWYEKIRKKLPKNVSLSYVKLDYDGDYSKMVSKYANRFDIIVIDGRDRINCAMNALIALKPCGIIIWDNSDRIEYEEGFDFLYKNGFRKIEFVGLAPIWNIKQETGIFYRLNNCINI